MVTVDNTVPKKKDDAPVGTLLVVSYGTSGSEHVDKDGDIIDTSNPVAKDNRQYHKLTVPFKGPGGIFGDADGDGDIKKYMAESNEPYIKVVGEPSAGSVVIDVMKDVGSTFPLVVWVVDGSDDPSEKVTLTAPSPMPLMDIYEVTQVEGDGNFGDAKVYQREGIAHTLTFEPVVAGTAAGFQFVKEFVETEIPGTGAVVDGTATVDGTDF